MIVFSIICSIITGNTQELSSGLMNGAEKAVKLLITLFGVMVFWLIIQSNYFATKLDIANVKLEMAQMKIELKKYADDGDKELLHNLDTKYQNILIKLDKIK